MLNVVHYVTVTTTSIYYSITQCIYQAVVQYYVTKYVTWKVFVFRVLASDLHHSIVDRFLSVSRHFEAAIDDHPP